MEFGGWLCCGRNVGVDVEADETRRLGRLGVGSRKVNFWPPNYCSLLMSQLRGIL